MVDTSFFDDFFGQNLPVCDHGDSANLVDNNNEDVPLSTQRVDYAPLEHVHDNRSNHGRSNIRRRVCSELGPPSRQQRYKTPLAVPIFHNNTCSGFRFLSLWACTPRGPQVPVASSMNFSMEDITTTDHKVQNSVDEHHDVHKQNELD